MVNPLSIEPIPEGKKRPYKKLPPESERPINPRTGKPLSDTEMYAVRQTEKQPTEVSKLPQERLAELRKRVADIQTEIPQLEFNIKILPDDHPLRRQAEMRLTSLQTNLKKANDELKIEEAKVEKQSLISEIARTRSELEHVGRDLTERIRATEEKVKGTPAEIAEAVKESKAIIQRLTEIENKFDEAMKKTTAPEPEPEAVEEETVEVPPQEFSITPKFSPLTGRLTGFIVADPEGHTATKLERYYKAILQEYKKETDPTALQNADVNYTEYRVTIVLPQKQETAKQWWTIPTAGGEFSVSEYFQPSATDISRFWKIYHSSDVHADKGFLQMKEEMTDYAKRRGWSPKPARAANLDKYLYAYYQAQAPKLKDWFFRTIYEVPE